MRTTKAAIWSILIALLAGSLALSPVRSLDTAAKGGEPRVSVEQLSRHISFLSSDKLQGRRAGTPGAEEAARYIAAEFRQHGLSPVASGGFFQLFDFVAEVRLGNRNSFHVRTPGGARSLKVGEDYMPLAFSSADIAAGPIVLAGYGISAPDLQYDNYAGLEPSGKVIIVLRGSPDGDNPHGRFADRIPPGREIEVKVLKAREKGARGVIFISDSDNFHEDRLSRLRHDLNFMDARVPAVIVSRDVARSILAAGGSSLEDSEKRFKSEPSPISLKDIEAEFKTDTVRITRQTANVIGMIRGSDPLLSSQYVVIGAHYDHLGLGGPESLAQKPEGEIHHGADDNASGTSALIELARVLAADRARIKRSLVFSGFSGEELGLLGSAAYTKNPPVPLESTVAMINMDMIGRMRNGTVIVGGAGTSPAWKPLLDKLNTPVEAKTTLAPEHHGGLRLTLQQDGYGPSDHQSFYVRDIPVLFFFTGSHDDYHKPSDTADRVNIEGVKQIAELVRDLTVAIASENERIAFTKVQAESRPAGRGFRVYLGTIPNYSDQGEGLKLDGVRPGSPAERAGLRAGDVIIKIGRVPVKNVYDYTYGLGEMRAGEETEVVIRRAGTELTLKITPERRQ